MAAAKPWRNLTSMIKRGAAKPNPAPKRQEKPPPERDPLTALYRFVIMQHDDEAKLYESIVEGFLDIEQTTAMVLNDAFSRLMPGGSIMLFMYIEETDYMCGIMELLSQGAMVTSEISDDESALMFRFQINWLEVKDVPITLIEQAGAPPLNEGSFFRGSLKEISTEQGLQMYFSYVDHPRSSSLFERCVSSGEPESESSEEDSDEDSDKSAAQLSN